MQEIDLPRKYEYKEGQSREEYKKYNGWNKISYSQSSSFLDEEDDGYRGDYIGNYFLGIRSSNVFAEFGSACGDYVNTQDQRIDDYLDDLDKEVLDNINKSHPVNAEFEFEILIDLEPFGLKQTCLQGFTDRQHITKDGEVEITDYKTLNLAKKKKFYASEKYKQTKVYGFGLEELGYKVGKTYVTGLGRKGNQLDKTALHYNGKTNMGIRLSGDVEIIENPYDREEAIKCIVEIVETCKEIDKYYKLYNKMFK